MAAFLLYHLQDMAKCSRFRYNIKTVKSKPRQLCAVDHFLIKHLTDERVREFLRCHLWKEEVMRFLLDCINQKAVAKFVLQNLDDEKVQWLLILHSHEDEVAEFLSNNQLQLQ